ncbi:MAG: IS110 family transposase [Sphingobacteriales bacterium]|nr:IS110 family transposase [Sphingobacteriales bacterium]
MKSYLFIGIDISKATLDVSIFTSSAITDIHYQQFSNSTKGFLQLLKWLKQKCEGISIEDWRACMENTGMYSLELNCFLQEKGIWQSLENALQIKRSMGVVRGKTDKADCQVIARYAYRFFDKLKQYVLPSVTLLRLKALFSQRERLVSMHSQLLVGNQSMKGYPKELVKDIQKQNEGLLKSLALQIKVADKSIMECLQADDELQRKSKLIQSVPGIGQQTAAYLLIVSRGMESFATAREFACYSGCAPFEHTSGSSIRGKTKVHFLANRKMKMLLHQKTNECTKCGPFQTDLPDLFGSKKK